MQYLLASQFLQVAPLLKKLGFTWVVIHKEDKSWVPLRFRKPKYCRSYMPFLIQKGSANKNKPYAKSLHMNSIRVVSNRF